MRVVLALLVAAACARGAPSAGSVGDLRAGYSGNLARLAKARGRLAVRLAQADAPRAAVLAEAGDLLIDALRRDILPAWAGTPWDFNGTTRVPGEGRIACGHYVAGILDDAGFRVERRRLGQQASELIIRTLVPESEIRRFRQGDVGAVVDAVAAGPRAIYLIGLDTHAGLLVHADGAVVFCHASYLSGAVLCEDARSSPAMRSRYHVIGRLSNDRTLAGWLAGQPWPTLTR